MLMLFTEVDILKILNIVFLLNLLLLRSVNYILDSWFIFSRHYKLLGKSLEKETPPGLRT